MIWFVSQRINARVSDGAYLVVTVTLSGLVRDLIVAGCSPQVGSHLTRHGDRTCGGGTNPIFFCVCAFLFLFFAFENEKETDKSVAQ